MRGKRFDWIAERRPREAVVLPSFWRVAAMKTRGVTVFMGRQKAEGRRQKAEGRIPGALPSRLSFLLSSFLLLPSQLSSFAGQTQGSVRVKLLVSDGLHANDGGDAEDVVGGGAARHVGGGAVE